MKFSSVFAGAALFASTVLAEVDPIVIKGSKFFYSGNDTQFYIRGVAYQQEYSGPDSSSNSFKDPLADSAACARDVPYLQKLGTNTIRVYAVDPNSDHSSCMKALDDAGIYVIADLSSPGESINRNEPVWNADLYNRYVSVVDDLSQYKNVIGFFAGNEVSNSADTTSASAFVKAAVRDMKQYIKAKNYRPMGVGYATSDDSSIRKNMANYFNCHSSDESIDFWGYNVYSWCGDSNYEKSGYKERTEEFRDYSVPVFFAEYGCNAVQPRQFTETDTLFGDKMADVWSGGIVYMYFQEANNYGLVSVDGDKVSTLDDFNNLSKHIAKASPTGVKKSEYKPKSNSLQKCPEVNNEWAAAATPLPPSPNQSLCSCMEDSLSCALKNKNPSGDKIGELMGTVCGYDVCAGIGSNATKGEYGAYSVCSPEQQLSYVMDLYYKKMGKSESACDFKGAAATQSSSSPSGTCSSLIEEAGSSGTGTVTTSPTASADSGSGGSSGSSASGSQGAGQMISPSAVHVGYWQVGVYAVTAFMAGVGMILL